MAFFDKIKDLFNNNKESSEESSQKQKKLEKSLEKTKTSLFNKITKTVVGKSKIDDNDLDDIEEIQSRVNLIIDERERVARALLEIGVHTLPSRANFLLASTNNQDAQTIEGLVQFLFNEAGIIVNRTRETGLEGFMRFSLSFPENNELLIKTCSRYLAEGLS